MSNDANPHAINFKKFQRYNLDFFNLQEIVFFEFLTMLHTQFRKESFFHSVRAIRKETGLKRSALETVLRRFTDLSIITIEIRNRVSFYRVDYGSISSLLPQIYRSDSEQEENIRRWHAFHLPYFDRRFD
jgi:hypothetical protein